MEDADALENPAEDPEAVVVDLETLDGLHRDHLVGLGPDVDGWEASKIWRRYEHCPVFIDQLGETLPSSLRELRREVVTGQQGDDVVGSLRQSFIEAVCQQGPLHDDQRNTGQDQDNRDDCGGQRSDAKPDAVEAHQPPSVASR